MIKIAIVEDDLSMSELIIGCMADLVEDIAVECKAFESAEDFLREMEHGKGYDILLADIGLPKMNGIELGTIVREEWPDMSLVFLTSYSEYAAESYRINADQYVLKNDMGQRLWKVIKGLIKKRIQENGSYKIVISTESGVPERHVMYYKDIIYASKVKGSKYVEYTTATGQYRVQMTMDELEKELSGEEFIIVDRSYIVNMKSIVKISDHMLYLKGSYRVAISRSHYSRVKRQIHEYGRRKQ